jgi:homoserine kinase
VLKNVIVQVPATSANIGPGFDTMGVALDLQNRFYVTVVDDKKASENNPLPGILTLGSDSLAHHAMDVLYETQNKQCPDVFIQTLANIPFSRGLGSSSTAVVGGLLAANALLDYPLDIEGILDLAIAIEGHPDNVAPALFGGFQIAVKSQTGITRVSVLAPESLRAVVCIPEKILPTEEARAVLPPAWTRAETVENLGRVAVLMTALLTENWQLLRVGMEDRLHQPYRAPLIPGFDATIAAALNAGAYGACLSGSGSAMLAFVGKNESSPARVGEAMCAAVRATGEKAQWMALDIARTGARVI